MALLGKNIQLTGISQKGKNRIREHGAGWTVLAETNRVLFAADIPGPWLFVAPHGQGQDSKASRWIHATNDSDFSVIILNG